MSTEKVNIIREVMWGDPEKGAKPSVQWQQVRIHHNNIPPEIADAFEVMSWWVKNRSNCLSPNDLKSPRILRSLSGDDTGYICFREYAVHHLSARLV